MRNVRLVSIGFDSISRINLLKDKLNSIQDEFSFVFKDDSIPLEGVPMKGDELSTSSTLTRLKSYMSERFYVEYPIGITSARITDELFYDNDDNASIISLADWSKYSNESSLKALVYFVAALLLDTRFSTPVHEKAVGCLNDECWEKSDVQVGLSKCSYCADCMKAISSAVERGQIPLREVMGVYRIIDDIGGRKQCFVIMPFDPKYKELYVMIKDAVESSGYICSRADEIAETRNIVEIIIEHLGRSTLIVAELSAKNPNVFYELGYAHALGRNTILLVEQGSNVPFDTNHRQYIEYDKENLGTTLLLSLA